MSRITAVDPATLEGKPKAQLDAVKAKIGMIPNLYRVAANSPASLDGLLGLTGAVAAGRLGPKLREQIALAVAQTNGCDYCLSAHTLLGKGAGLGADDIAKARDGSATDPRANAVLHLARQIVETRGRLSDGDLAAARAAGLDQSDIVETIANVVVNIFTNYLNNTAHTEIDFPVVRAAG